MTSEVRRDVVLYSRQCGIGALGALHAAGQDVDGREVLLVADADVLHALRVLLVGQELPRAVLRGPLERHAVLALGRPLAMQVGVAPRRTRNGAIAFRRLTRAAGLRCGDDAKRDGEDTCREDDDPLFQHESPLLAAVDAAGAKTR